MSFSENLQAVRKKNQLSQEELAELLGVSRQAVSKWELGDGYPEVEKLLILSKKLNVSLDSLMTGSVPGNNAMMFPPLPATLNTTNPRFRQITIYIDDYTTQQR